MKNILVLIEEFLQVEVKMETLPYDLQYEIGLATENPNDLLQLCQTSKVMAEVARENKFWFDWLNKNTIPRLEVYHSDMNYKNYFKREMIQEYIYESMIKFEATYIREVVTKPGLTSRQRRAKSQKMFEEAKWMPRYRREFIEMLYELKSYPSRASPRLKGY
jgi:hypothetical protein